MSHVGINRARPGIHLPGIGRHPAPDDPAGGRRCAGELSGRLPEGGC